MTVPHTFLLSLSLLQAGHVPEYWASLDPGPHPVGFSQSWVADSTRRLPHGDQYGVEFRPILMNLWYPAVDADTDPIRYMDYFEGALRAAENTALRPYAEALVEYELDVVWTELAGGARESVDDELVARVDAFLDSRTGVHRDATAKLGSFPVVVYVQGSRSSMDDNSALCEYLASRGFLVVGSAFSGEDNTSFATNVSDGSRQRDIRRLVLELVRSRGVPRSVTVVGHSAGAQAMLLFAVDPSAPIDAVVSLDTTQDYVMLSDRTWAYYTDEVIQNRRLATAPMMFVAGPQALFEVADSLSSVERTLVTVPDLSHNEFISQGLVKRRLASKPGEADLEVVEWAYTALTRYVGDWVEAAASSGAPPRALEPLEVAVVREGDSAPLGSAPATSARELRHLFATTSPEEFARLAVDARSRAPEATDDFVLMMLLVHAIRAGNPEHARATYRALLSLDPGIAGVLEKLEQRASLFERIDASIEAAEWRSLAKALTGNQLGDADGQP